jgi:hypothetical protein
MRCSQDLARLWIAAPRLPALKACALASIPREGDLARHGRRSEVNLLTRLAALSAVPLIAATMAAGSFLYGKVPAERELRMAADHNARLFRSPHNDQRRHVDA